MPSLLCTLGTSWAVVPEAFLLGNGDSLYDHVCILTTSDPKTIESMAKVETWFRGHHPGTRITGLAIEGLTDLACSEDHQRFEEALFRAYFAMLGEGQGIHVCLAGGFKTMSAAAQEAAGLLGCEKLFHITAPFGLRTDSHEEILDAIHNGSIRLIGLGSRSGWPTILELAPLAESPGAPGQPFLIEDFTLSNAIHHRLEAASLLSANEHELATLPFPQIARWAPNLRAWLNESLDPATDASWLLALPKVELHCHLGGFATHGEPLALVREAAEDVGKLLPSGPPPCPAGWPLPATPVSLGEYMKLGDATGSTLLKDPGCLRRHCELLYNHLLTQNILHAEIRCSPANYATDGRSPWTVLSDIKAAFDAVMNARPGCHVNLIIIATRREKGDYRTAIGRHLTLAVTAAEHWGMEAGCRIVGVDLAGYEDITTRAHYFREDFRAVHRCGLALTVHAGENDDAEGIWSAVYDLNARRIGHALSLGESPDLLRSVADRRIGVEMCPYANLQIKGSPLDAAVEGNPQAYPLRRYLAAGVPVTVNTDNIGISNASLTENFFLLPRLCPGIRRLDVLQLLRNAVDQSFLSPAQKNHLLARITIPHL